MMAAPALAVRQVRHRFPGGGGVDVLDEVSLSVDAGSFVSVVGPSGCGKSTLLRILAGLVVPTTGDLLVDDEPVAGRPGCTAFQPQRDLLLPWLRVLGNATLGAEVAGVPRATARAAAQARMGKFGLAGFERAWPSELSGGMRQRLALLRTFLMPRTLLLLDEPFGALDAITRRDLHQWLQAVGEQDPRTVLLVTHDVEEALVLADTVVVLSRRPARVITEVAVGLPRPRPPDVVTEPEFVALKAKLLSALDAGPHDDIS